MDELRIEEEHRRDGGAWFIEQDGRRVGEMTYAARAPGTITILHTEVGPELRGRGAGQKLVAAGIAWARAHGKKVVPECEFARRTIAKDPALQDVL